MQMAGARAEPPGRHEQAHTQAALDRAQGHPYRHSEPDRESVVGPNPASSKPVWTARMSLAAQPDSSKAATTGSWTSRIAVSARVLLTGQERAFPIRCCP
jgi:hypothetical protein